MTTAELIFGALVAVTAFVMIYQYLDNSSRRGVEIWEDEPEEEL